MHGGMGRCSGRHWCKSRVLEHQSKRVSWWRVLRQARRQTDGALYCAAGRCTLQVVRSICLTSSWGSPFGLSHITVHVHASRSCGPGDLVAVRKYWNGHNSSSHQLWARDSCPSESILLLQKIARHESRHVQCRRDPTCMPGRLQVKTRVRVCADMRLRHRGVDHIQPAPAVTHPTTLQSAHID